jgi:uncharacterized membrane protein
MTVKKTEFLATLRKKLYQLPPQDVEKTIEYYSEMIDDYTESGYPEDAAVARMGRVDDIALQILAGVQNPTFAAHGVQKQRKNGLLIALLIVGFPIWFSLLVTAFCLLLTAAILIATLAMVVPWSLVVAFGASAIGLLIGMVVIFVGEGIGAAALVLGTALILGALCIFALWVAIRLTGLGAKGIGGMFRGFFNLLLGRRNRI